jgi:predicted ATPase
MLRSIRLENFRNFRSAVFPVGALTVIAGPNSSGKTSVLHAVRLAVGALKMALGDEFQSPAQTKSGEFRVANDLVVRDHTNLLPVADWRSIFTDSEVGADIVGNVVLEFEPSDSLQSLSVRLTYANNELLKVTVHVRSSRVSDALSGLRPKSKGRPQRLRDELARVAPRAVFVPAFFGVTLNEEYRTSAAVDRLMDRGEQGRVVRNLLARLDGDGKRRLNRFLGTTVGAEILEYTVAAKAEETERLTVSFRDSNGPLDLSAAGAGLINLISLFAALERSRPSNPADARPLIFLLDEPEAHLHPKLQGDVGEALALLVSESGAQAVIATHSIEMINRMGLRDGVRLLHVDKRENQVVELSSQNDIVQSLAGWCDLTPFTALNFLARRRLLFHEGPTDKNILDACARVYFSHDPARLRRYGDWTAVPISGVANAAASEVLGKLISPEVFEPLETGPRVRVVRLRDRDAIRKPGFTVRDTGKGPIHTDVVWSRYSIESLFVDENVLTAWLLPEFAAAGVGEAEARKIVAEAIGAADSALALNKPAAKQMLITSMREDFKKPGDAFDAALDTVLSDPKTFQRGHDRSQFVLKAIRDRLPLSRHNRIRSSITEVLRHAPLEALGKSSDLIPEEIRRVLDLLAEP